ncbi:hypothetical protein NDU88_004851 [Pleurodeles waltl]|uniref:Uncharacterized protein n=1 Tax=Pleurodeles waltl TaxID=8319 RepID=A0AAV7KZJ7_PLEWA|nr:hypothetical protein NDU88_004851 [Pleurodeles waltl]
MDIKGLIPTLAVYDRQGGGRLKHRQQAGGASFRILTAALMPRSPSRVRRFSAGFPPAGGILHGGTACSAAMGIPTPFPPSSGGRSFGGRPPAQRESRNDPAVFRRGLLNWIHASHTKKVMCPTDEELEVSKTTAAEKEVSGPESIQRGTETEGEPAQDGLVPQNEFQRGDSEPISAEITGETTQIEVLPEADGYGFEVEPVSDPEGEGEEAEGGQSVPTPPEPLAEPSRENTIAQEEGAVQRSERPSRKKTHKGDNWPKQQVAGEKVVPSETIEEEVDTTKKEDLSEGKLQSERKLKRKRVANRRYAGPEWAYATSAEWQQEFLVFCFHQQVPGQYYGT